MEIKSRYILRIARSTFLFAANLIFYNNCFVNSLSRAYFYSLLNWVKRVFGYCLHVSHNRPPFFSSIFIYYGLTFSDYPLGSDFGKVVLQLQVKCEII